MYNETGGTFDILDLARVGVGLRDQTIHAPWPNFPPPSPSSVLQVATAVQLTDGVKLLSPAANAYLPNSGRSGNGKPTWDFHWQPVRGANEYAFSLEHDGKSVFQTMTTATKYTHQPALGYGEMVPENWSWSVSARLSPITSTGVATNKFSVLPLPVPMRITGLKLTEQDVKPGSVLQFSYQIENAEGRPIDPSNWVIQHWIERLGSDFQITVEKAAARNGSRYAAGGIAAKFLKGFPPKPGKPCVNYQQLDTKGYAPGRYRFSVDIELQDKEVHSAGIEFDLKASTAE
jgi:hypothetical protein